jgi:hypothetical protein
MEGVVDGGGAVEEGLRAVEGRILKGEDGQRTVNEMRVLCLRKDEGQFQMTTIFD